MRGTRMTPVLPRTTLRAAARPGIVWPGVDGEPGHPGPDRGGRAHRGRGAGAARRARARVRGRGPRPRGRGGAAPGRRERRRPPAARHLPARHVRSGGVAPAARRRTHHRRRRHHRARDLSVVQAAVSFGVTQYLVKPFTSLAVRQKLERYSAYRASLAGAGLAVAQGEIDNLFGALRETAETSGLPKGISSRVVADGRRGPAPALEGDAPGAHPAAGGRGRRAVRGGDRRELGMSRVTTRRYLEYLVDAGLARRQARYGGGPAGPSSSTGSCPTRTTTGRRPALSRGRGCSRKWLSVR